MSALKIYVDEDTSNADLVFALRQRRVDTVMVSDAGLRGATDENQLLWASRSGRAMANGIVRSFGLFQP